MKIIQICKLMLESVFYTLLLLSIAAGIIYGVSVMHENGTKMQAQSYCENNTGKALKIKKIISVENTYAKIEMEDNSMYDYEVKTYIGGYKGGATIRHTTIKVGDVVCVKN